MQRNIIQSLPALRRPNFQSLDGEWNAFFRANQKWFHELVAQVVVVVGSDCGCRGN